jgi:hypothetical protein
MKSRFTTPHHENRASEMTLPTERQFAGGAGSPQGGPLLICADSCESLFKSQGVAALRPAASGLGSAVTATGATLSATDSVTNGPSRF